MGRSKAITVGVGLAPAGLLLGGCVQRTITITSEPSGALVWLNDREVGRTPIDVDFDYYGTYDVRLERPGHEPVMTSGNALAPWWDNVPLDLFAELTPATLHSRVEWHYVLEPQDDDPEALTERARELRSRLPEDEPSSPAQEPTEDASGGSEPLPR